MNRPRIVHLIESLGHGGAERLLADLLAHLDRTRFEHHVLYLFPDHALRPEIDALGIPCECLELRSASDWTRGWLRLRARLAALRPAVVHTTLQKADMYGRLAARASRVATTVLSTLHECPYNPEVYVDNPGLNRAKYALVKQLDRATARWCNDAFIVVSRYTQGNLQRYFGIPDQRLHQIYSGVDLDRFDRIDARRLEGLRQEFGIRSGDLVLVNVARLVPQKGQRYLIEAMASVRARNPRVKLLIRGEGPLRAALQSHIASLELGETVRMIEGYAAHEDVLHLLAVGDVFLFPSLFEGLGIAALEAMALGKPCVACRVGPLPEVVEEGVTGLLVAPQDPAALAGAILRLADDEPARLRMGRAGRARVEALFDLRTAVRRVEAVYAMLTGADPSRAPAQGSVPREASATLEPIGSP